MASRKLAIFIAPAMAYLIAMVGFPTFYSIYLSLTKFSLVVSGTPQGFIGLDNYAYVANYVRFHTSLGLTAIYTVAVLVIEYFLGLAIALTMNEEFRGKSVFRTLFIAPLVTTPVAAALMWRYMFDMNFGVINYFLRRLGLPEQVWLSVDNALTSVIIASVWQWTPFMFLILFAGLQSLPPDIYESAQVDGASAWQQFRHITFRMLLPFTFIAIIFRGFEAFKVFDIVAILTKGGPADATSVASYFAFILAFRYFDIGKATAAAFLLMLIAGTAVFWALRPLRRT